MSSHPITEDDLHGFVDHLLDSARRSEVQTYLDDHPEIAARIAAFSRQREALRAAAACGTRGEDHNAPDSSPLGRSIQRA